MKDNDKGLENRAPMKTDERVVLLSPAIDSWKGKQFAHMPALAGEVPANNIGLAPDHDEVPDRIFRSRSMQESGNGLPARKLTGKGVSKPI